MNRFALCLAAAAALGGCSSSAPGPSRVDPSGPPAIRLAVVERHAREFDGDLAGRPAGSQQEQIASQYLLGHIQRAGYQVRLEAVPVGDLVESTNLVAFPPSGEQPTTIVTVGFDARAGDEPWGASIGLFLELARALYAAEESHRVEFVALGAERTTDHRGSRRLAQQLREGEADPHLVTIAAAGVDAPLAFAGDGAGELVAIANDLELEAGDADFELVGGVDVFGRAGFDHVLASGPPDELGPVLLSWLEERED